MTRTRIKLISDYEDTIENLVNNFIKDPKNKVEKVNLIEFYFSEDDDGEAYITAYINYELGK